MKETGSQKQPLLESTLMSMTDREFQQLRDLVYARLGINLTEKKRSMLIGRLQKLLRTSGFKSFQDYYDYLVNEPGMDAMTELVNRVTTNYSFFYRGKSHFEFFIQRAFPETLNILRKRNSRMLQYTFTHCLKLQGQYLKIKIRK